MTVALVHIIEDCKEGDSEAYMLKAVGLSVWYDETHGLRHDVIVELGRSTLTVRDWMLR